MFHLQRLAISILAASTLTLPTHAQDHDFVGQSARSVLNEDLAAEITWRIDGSNDTFPESYLTGYGLLFTVVRQDPNPIRDTTTHATIWIDNSFELPDTARDAIVLASRFGVDFEIWKEANDKQWKIPASSYGDYGNWDTSEAETKGSSVSIGKRVSIVIRRPRGSTPILEFLANAVALIIALGAVTLAAGMLTVCLRDPRR